ncbi:MAG: SIR2 family NAD-dependent protein deacylase [Coriobacteriales bacterium]|jgi:NAD-dependent SIR2 family protein deacetylase
MKSTNELSARAEQLGKALAQADHVLIGAGAGLSSAAGLLYSGERFERYFSDFQEKYGISDMYSGGFYPFETPEERWAWWSRHIWVNRYEPGATSAYKRLLELVADKDYFVITTNVDHQFQLAGFDKKRLFYTQGDYGLFQCSRPCAQVTYDNEEIVRQMVKQQQDMKVPSELIPRCPRCGEPLTTNLRVDDTFVEDQGWHEAARRYRDFLDRTKGSRTLLFELGVGNNTPGIIKYPFWRMALENENAVYTCLNLSEAYAPREIEKRSIVIDADISAVLEMI